MSATKTAWHPPFTGLLQERCPRWIRVTAEVQFSAEPLRVDDLLEVWSESERDPRDTGGTLRGLWRFVRRVALLEFKSVARMFRHGDLYRLLAYGALWLASHARDSDAAPRLTPAELTLVLAVPVVNAALREELAALGLALRVLDDGYHLVEGLPWLLVVVELRAAAAHERDPLLGWFGGTAPSDLESHRWMRQHLPTRSDAMHTHATPDLEGYDALVEEILDGFTPEQRLAGLTPEQRLAGIAPEQRLAGIAPEQRLAGIAPEETVLALPDSVLRGLPASYVDALPPRVRDAVRARVNRACGTIP
jgi:hypothetical protein